MSAKGMRQFFLISAASLLLSGCATPYVEPPASNPTASLKLTNQSTFSSVLMVTFADGKNCPWSTRTYISDPNGVSSDLARGQSVDVRIKANEPFSLSAHSVWGNGSCKVVVTFSPKANLQYAVQFDSDRYGCRLGVGRLEGSNLVREESTQKRKVVQSLFNDLFNHGKSCE